MSDGRWTLSIRWKAFLEVVCLFRGHVWKAYTIIHPAWNNPGRYCERCKRSQVYRYSGEVVDGVWVQHLVDHRGRRIKEAS